MELLSSKYPKGQSKAPKEPRKSWRESRRKAAETVRTANRPTWAPTAAWRRVLWRSAQASVFPQRVPWGVRLIPHVRASVPHVQREQCCHWTVMRVTVSPSRGHEELKLPGAHFTLYTTLKHFFISSLFILQMTRTTYLLQIRKLWPREMKKLSLSPS